MLLSCKSHKKTLEELHAFAQKMHNSAQHCIGYPGNLDFHLHEFMEWWVNSGLADLHLNEAGRPELESSYKLNAHTFELEVIAYFASLYHFPKDNYWGYITTGSTLGSQQGLLMGRQALRNYGRPLAYFTQESHYTIKSILSMLDIEYQIVKSHTNGEMDIEDLADKIDTSRPALLNINIGTTFKGGIDNFNEIYALISTLKLPAYYFHVDAALFGGYLPFIKEPAAPTPFFDVVPYDSITISGHKFFGSPVPLGVFLTTRKHSEGIKSDYIEYLKTDNLMIPCSRSTLNTLIFWWLIHTISEEVWTREAEGLLKRTKYLVEQLKKLQYSCYWNSLFSNTVYFQAPSQALCHKWSLATVTDENLGKLAHIVVMQHVTQFKIDEFIKDLKGEISNLLPSP